MPALPRPRGRGAAGVVGAPARLVWGVWVMAEAEEQIERAQSPVLCRMWRARRQKAELTGRNGGLEAQEAKQRGQRARPGR